MSHLNVEEPSFSPRISQSLRGQSAFQTAQVMSEPCVFHGELYPSSICIPVILMHGKGSVKSINILARKKTIKLHIYAGLCVFCSSKCSQQKTHAYSCTGRKSVSLKSNTLPLAHPGLKPGCSFQLPPHVYIGNLSVRIQSLFSYEIMSLGKDNLKPFPFVMSELNQTIRAC